VRAVGEHPDRRGVFADAVDPAGEMEFGAERGLEEAVEDLGVAESRSFAPLLGGDRRRVSGGRGRRRGRADRRDQDDREQSSNGGGRVQFFTTTVAPTATRL